ncbi:hypothetical protein FHU23_004311 [Clostridium saccharobutylicum]|nr:hypothetical protein [Clostridium saccharobutylicum]MBA8792117.1 hypothetical protein [Clostridium saccharobutylicum]MBA8898858.1 hypothetical protein [Clostridium saccharobutylicum]MBA8980721.1 hypothetical protein [Clostridium saccharobutylicum]MBA8996344.1 hypothetical protein [Clostridium saccharobutylicum]
MELHLKNVVHGTVAMMVLTALIQKVLILLIHVGHLI